MKQTLLATVLGLMALLPASRAAAADEPPAIRAARSVHLGYVDQQGVAFYNEMRVECSVPGSYFMAAGFNHGYFGIQEQGGGRKVVIFSVWDPTKGDDAAVVPLEQRVEVLHTGDDVLVKRFGGEGTGGQSFFEYDWKLNTDYRFLVRATITGEKTAYAGYFFVPETNRWKHLVTFRTRTGGDHLKGLYSFVEDFRRDGKSAEQMRRATFANGWVQGDDAAWKQIVRARFTASGSTWEAKDSIDAGVIGDRFYLQTGDLASTLQSHPLRSILERKADTVEPPNVPTDVDHRLLCAGGAELFLLDAAAAQHGTVGKLWTWSGATAAGLEESQRRWFEHLDECKPVDNGSKILVCASNSGCALLEFPSGKLLWQASVTNAHSLELLPNRRVVVASSLSGDQLVLFDLRRSNEALATAPLHSAHGLVWDKRRQVLWALGFDELRSYTLKDWDTEKPSLALSASHHLPDDNGHDLRPVPGSNDLILTTETAVWLFDRERARFREHSLGSKFDNIKSIDVHPASGRTVVGQWSKSLSLLAEDGKITLPDNRPYKARWFVNSGE